MVPVAAVSVCAMVMYCWDGMQPDRSPLLMCLSSQVNSLLTGFATHTHTVSLTSRDHSSLSSINNAAVLAPTADELPEG